MSYPPATPPEGYNPYEEDPFPETEAVQPPPPPPPSPTPPSSPPPPPPAAPAGYPFGGPEQSSPAPNLPPPPGGALPGSAPGYGYVYAPSQAAEKNGTASAALILGILSIVLCVTILLSVPMGIIAIVLGVKGRRFASEGRATNGGSAVGGIITGSIGAALGVFSWFILFLAIVTG